MPEAQAVLRALAAAATSPADRDAYAKALASLEAPKPATPAPQRAKGLRGAWVNSGAPAEGEEPVIVFGRILSADEPDAQGDRMPDPDERAKTLAALKADIAAGRLLEMGVNHEGAPTPELKALDVDECSEDVEIGGQAFKCGDLVLKAALYGARKAAFLAGKTTGFSLEAVEDPSMEQQAA